MKSDGLLSKITPKRIHSVEIHDLAATPQPIREAIVDALGRGFRWAGFYEALAPTFASFCERAQCEEVLDLCSGSGQPVATLLDALSSRGLAMPRFTLSDLLPNPGPLADAAARHRDHIQVVTEPVDATAVSAELNQPARTVFNAFHHFPPELAADILRDTVRSNTSICIVEAFPRNPLGILPTLPALGLAMAATPFVGANRLAKTLFLPAATVIGTWDGFISTLRIHSEADLRQMVVEFDHYDWRYEVVPYPLGGRATVFSGVPY
ncbi:MAG: hypothetical protein ACI9OJ_002667 [Myxococcota bacterium]|jgi:hypothetical protein